MSGRRWLSVSMRTLVNVASFGRSLRPIHEPTSAMADVGVITDTGTPKTSNVPSPFELLHDRRCGIDRYTELVRFTTCLPRVISLLVRMWMFAAITKERHPS